MITKDDDAKYFKVSSEKYYRALTDGDYAAAEKWRNEMFVWHNRIQRSRTVHDGGSYYG